MTAIPETEVTRPFTPAERAELGDRLAAGWTPTLDRPLARPADPFGVRTDDGWVGDEQAADAVLPWPGHRQDADEAHNTIRASNCPVCGGPLNGGCPCQVPDKPKKPPKAVTALPASNMQTVL